MTTSQNADPTSSRLGIKLAKTQITANTTAIQKVITFGALSCWLPSKKEYFSAVLAPQQHAGL
jgi:hypothetical protein